MSISAKRGLRATVLVGLLTVMLGASASQAGAAKMLELRLPWAAGKSWTMLSGPHNTNGCPNGGFNCTGAHPWNSLDLTGGDGIVRAAASGTVQSTTHCPPHSNFVIINHGGGWHTTYYHLVDIRVHPGDQVRVGARLGTISNAHGCGGHSNYPHVHFSVAKYTGPYSWTHGGVDLDGFEIGDWVFHDGRTQYSGCATNRVTHKRVCPGGLLKNNGAEDCVPISPVVWLTAKQVGCGTARQVVSEWGSRSDCQPNGTVCHVQGFACQVPPKGNYTQLRCGDGDRLIVGKLGPY
jgi:murein DD-endopeptidase MepM/ murein hydrolase activator NlpD